MLELSKKLKSKIEKRKTENSLRQLTNNGNLIDFSSNDYLGLSKSKALFTATHNYLVSNEIFQNGSTGSRLISGNHKLYSQLENELANIHNSESALIFNSGYDANIGFFSSVPQKGDVILYDSFIHASIRDGIRLSNSKAFSYEHNNLEDLKLKLNRLPKDTEIFIVTESVFSMDGDSPDLNELINISKKFRAKLIVDEAHAFGVFGMGLAQKSKLENHFFARIITYGKALGTHGAVILCNTDLKEYLINFSRSFIYTTALPPHSIASIKIGYELLLDKSEADKLNKNIILFKQKCKALQLDKLFISSQSAIQSCIIQGNTNIKSISSAIINKGFSVKAILSPTVQKNKERLRFCIHSFNTQSEIDEVLELLKDNLQFIETK